MTFTSALLLVLSINQSINQSIDGIFIAPLQNMDSSALQCKYINVNTQAYNDTKNKVKNEDNTHIVNKKKRRSAMQSVC